MAIADLHLPRPAGNATARRISLPRPLLPIAKYPSFFINRQYIRGGKAGPGAGPAGRHRPSSWRAPAFLGGSSPRPAQRLTHDHRTGFRPCPDGHPRSRLDRKAAASFAQAGRWRDPERVGHGDPGRTSAIPCLDDLGDGRAIRGETEEFCRRGAANWIIRADFPMQIFFRDTGEHAGNCGLHRFNWNTRVFEIGWWCRKRYQGKGLITEAAAALTGLCLRSPWRATRLVLCRRRERAKLEGGRAAGFCSRRDASERCDPDGTRRTMRVYATTRCRSPPCVGLRVPQTPVASRIRSRQRA